MTTKTKSELYPGISNTHLDEIITIKDTHAFEELSESEHYVFRVTSTTRGMPHDKFKTKRLVSRNASRIRREYVFIPIEEQGIMIRSLDVALQYAVIKGYVKKEDIFSKKELEIQILNLETNNYTIVPNIKKAIQITKEKLCNINRKINYGLRVAIGNHRSEFGNITYRWINSGTDLDNFKITNQDPHSLKEHGLQKYKDNYENLIEPEKAKLLKLFEIATKHVKRPECMCKPPTKLSNEDFKNELRPITQNKDGKTTTTKKTTKKRDKKKKKSTKKKKTMSVQQRGNAWTSSDDDDDSDF